MEEPNLFEEMEDVLLQEAGLEIVCKVGKDKFYQRGDLKIFRSTIYERLFLLTGQWNKDGTWRKEYFSIQEILEILKENL